jgi:hypothetical protein
VEYLDLARAGRDWMGLSCGKCDCMGGKSKRCRRVGNVEDRCRGRCDSRTGVGYVNCEVSGTMSVAVGSITVRVMTCGERADWTLEAEFEMWGASARR